MGVLSLHVLSSSFDEGEREVGLDCVLIEYLFEDRIAYECRLIEAMRPNSTRERKHWHYARSTFRKYGLCSLGNGTDNLRPSRSICTELFYRDNPLKIVRAEGSYMYDEQGNRYLDCINNVSHGRIRWIDMPFLSSINSSWPLPSVCQQAGLQTDGRVCHEQPVPARQCGDSCRETHPDATEEPRTDLLHQLSVGASEGFHRLAA